MNVEGSNRVFSWDFLGRKWSREGMTIAKNTPVLDLEYSNTKHPVRSIEQPIGAGVWPESLEIYGIFPCNVSYDDGFWKKVEYALSDQHSLGFT
jgi:hypothetical protein